MNEWVEQYTNSQIEDFIDEYVRSRRDRMIMRDRLVNGFRYEPLAEKYDISVSQVKRIVKKHGEVIWSQIAQK